MDICVLIFNISPGTTWIYEDGVTKDIKLPHVLFLEYEVVADERICIISVPVDLDISAYALPATSLSASLLISDILNDISSYPVKLITILSGLLTVECIKRLLVFLITLS